jgi:hypothetical protein
MWNWQKAIKSREQCVCKKLRSQAFARKEEKNKQPLLN